MPWYGERDAVVGDFARKLERERDEARELAEKWRDTAGNCAAMPITEEKFPWEVLP